MKFLDAGTGTVDTVKKIIIQSLVTQFGKGTGISVCADYKEYLPISAVVNGLRVTMGELPQ